MIQALTHSDRDICPDERIVQLSHVILGSWSAVRQMALQTSRARWCKPLNLAALPSHAESPSVLLPRHQSSVSQVSVSQVPAQASFTLRLLLSTSLLLRTAGTHAQNRQGSQGDQLRHLHLRAIRMFFELEKGQRISFSQLLRWLSMQQNTGACCPTSPRRPRDALSPGVCVPHGARASQEQLLQLLPARQRL